MPHDPTQYPNPRMKFARCWRGSPFLRSGLQQLMAPSST